MISQLSKNIVFFSRYPKELDLKDGYFQRVLAINRILSGFTRYYIDYDNSSIIPVIKKIKEGVFEIKTSKYNPFGLILIFIITLLLGNIYLHSILRLKSSFHKLLFLVARKRIVDLHGAVPEELSLYNKKNKSEIFEKVENFAKKNADIVISVSQSLTDHIKKKYDLDDRKFILLPIFSANKNKMIEKKFVKNIIYCGGLQKWQQTEKMLEHVFRHKGKYNFIFLVTDPETLSKKYFELYKENFPGIVRSSSPDEAREYYAKNCFGLVLREDIIVNRVACPTKLIEYLQNDIVPIVDSEYIGDFYDLGYKFVPYKNDLPDEKEWKEMICQNRKVLEKLDKISQAGIKALNASFISNK